MKEGIDLEYKALRDEILVLYRRIQLNNKLFLLTITEYFNGKVVNSKQFLKVKDRQTKIFDGKDTQLVKLPDLRDYIKYSDDNNNFNFDFILYKPKSESDTTLFYCKYPTPVTFKKYLMLRKFEDITIYPLFYNKFPIGIKRPFLAISSGYNYDKSLTSFCSLLAKPVEQWYKEFGMKHYYIVFLEIK